ncbi:sart3 [Scenedesmus sp. PABB004]|nr:sart3 [Scenedesmus sp. PABB004]
MAEPVAAADVAMGDSSDGSSSEEEEVELTPAEEQAIMGLEAALAAAPTVYDSHVQLIALLRKARLRERLRQARQRMHDLFPFNEGQWMDWINDEMDALASAEDVGRVKALFAAAVEDYVSVAIWESYLEFLQGVDPEVSGKTPAGLAAFREAAEAAITAAGLHLSEGPELWKLFRAFEQGLAEAAPADEKQVERVRALWHRQLQLPQLKAAELLAEYEAWEAEHGKVARRRAAPGPRRSRRRAPHRRARRADRRRRARRRQGSVPEHIRAAAQRSAAAAELRAVHEASVASDKPADAALLAAYMAYIQLEKAQKDPSRVVLLYERALAAFPVTAELWAQYGRYLEAELKVPRLINKAYARAVRNCPWVGSLWSSALRAHERLDGPDAEHEAMAERALAAGLQGPEDYIAVLLARADALRRALPAPGPGAAGSEAAARLRAWFGRARDTMAAAAPDAPDRALRLPGYWAHCEGALLGDRGAMRAVWEDTVKGPLGRYAETWLAWAAMERSLRELGAARSLFKRAYSRKYEAGGQVALAYEWMKFEREEGSAEELFAASLKVDPIIEEARAAAAAAAHQPAAAQSRAAAAGKQLTREEVRAMRRANDPNYKERKPGTKRDHGGEPVAPPPADGGAAAPAGKRSRGAGGGDADMADAGRGGVLPPERPVYTDEHTVFVKGMGFDVAEDDLRRLFEGLGVKSVRIGKDKFTGAARGFAYVEFESDDGVAKASEKDGQVLNGRRLFIAKSEPPGAGGRGRGRGGRGEGFGGRGGRGEGFGGRGGRGEGFGGRGRGGRGDGFDHHGGRGRGFGGRGRGRDAHQHDDAHGDGHMRHHLQLEDDKPARAPALVPRALLAKHAAGQQPGGDGGGGDDKPKSNADFKQMLPK